VPGDSQFGNGPQGNSPDTHAPLRGNMVYFMHDGLGSVCGLTNRFGEQVDAYRTQAYGSPLSGKLNDVNDQLLTGKRFDTASSLYYFGSRWYQPGTGTFMSQDSYQGSAMDPMSQNKYAYVNDNPTNMVDPWGYSANYLPQPQGNFFSNLIQNRIFQGIAGAGLVAGGAALVGIGGMLSIFGVGVPLAGIGASVILSGASLLANSINGGGGSGVSVGIGFSLTGDGKHSSITGAVNGIPIATLDTSPTGALDPVQQANNANAANANHVTANAEQHSMDPVDAAIALAQSNEPNVVGMLQHQLNAQTESGSFQIAYTDFDTFSDAHDNTQISSQFSGKMVVAKEGIALVIVGATVAVAGGMFVFATPEAAAAFVALAASRGVYFALNSIFAGVRIVGNVFPETGGASSETGPLIGEFNSPNLGSTGRVVAQNLNEQIAMTAVKTDPLQDASRLKIGMNDPRWPASDGWVKEQRLFNRVWCKGEESLA
jgi:RHS repeat-associated protein